MTQYGFFIDLSRCIGCNACTIACKQWHHIQDSSVKWMRVNQWENGAFPDIEVHTLPMMCLHCQKPVCAAACPGKAIRKEPKYGAVLVDQKKCTGEGACKKACPYGAPQFASDKPGEKMSKCNMCIDRLEQGLNPICVLSCSMRALEFGPLAELQKKYGLTNIPGLPDSLVQGFHTRPSAIFKPEDAKRQIVPWDGKKALALWQKRHAPGGEPLPDVFSDPKQVTEVAEGTYRREKLHLKSHTTEELMTYTTDDE
jgi:anaerobic dimethyl sulfoxide reductase subunit B